MSNLIKNFKKYILIILKTFNLNHLKNDKLLIVIIK